MSVFTLFGGSSKQFPQVGELHSWCIKMQNNSLLTAFATGNAEFFACHRLV